MSHKNIADHLESFLGSIDYGWKDNDSENAISVARFRNQPVDGMSTYVTLGLSHHVLSMPNKREVRQELVFSTFDTVPRDDIVSFLLSFSDFILTKHEALLRGQVIGPADPIISGSSMNAVYASMPVIFDDEFATFEGTSPSTVFVWLIPIFENEAKYIQEYGWEVFEDVLEQQDPDLWDVVRKPVVT
jgi:antitoxin YqcF